MASAELSPSERSRQSHVTQVVYSTVIVVVLVSPGWSCGVCVGAGGGGGGGGGAAGCCLHKWVWVDKPLS